MNNYSVKLIIFILTICLTKPSFSQNKFDPGVYNNLLRGIKFGITYEELLVFLRGSIARKYQPLIDGAYDIGEADRLLRSMQLEQEQVGQNFITFKGSRSGWDVSVIKDEFMHNTEESMLYLREGGDQIYLFFIKGTLWKIVITGKVCPKFADCAVQFSNSYGPPNEINFLNRETLQNPYEAIWENNDLTFKLSDKISEYNCMIMKWIDNKISVKITDLRGGKKAGSDKGSTINPVVKEAISGTKDEDVSDIVDDILGVKKDTKDVNIKKKKEK